MILKANIYLNIVQCLLCITTEKPLNKGKVLKINKKKYQDRKEKELKEIRKLHSYGIV